MCCSIGTFSSKFQAKMCIRVENMPALIDYVPCSPGDGRRRVVDTLHKGICVASNDAKLGRSINYHNMASASASSVLVELTGFAETSSTHPIESLFTSAAEDDLRLTLTSTFILNTCRSGGCPACWMDSALLSS